MSPFQTGQRCCQNGSSLSFNRCNFDSVPIAFRKQTHEAARRYLSVIVITIRLFSPPGCFTGFGRGIFGRILPAISLKPPDQKVALCCAQFCRRMHPNVALQRHLSFLYCFSGIFERFSPILRSQRAKRTKVQLFAPFGNMVGNPPGNRRHPAVPRIF